MSRIALASRLIVQVAAIVLLTKPVSGQASEFFPRLELQQAYTSDLDYAGDTEESTTRTSVILGLPFRREAPGGSIWELSYRGRLDRYGAFSQLDHAEHGARLAWSTAPNTLTGVSVETTYAMTQEQGNPDTDTQFLSRRTELSSLKARIGVERRLSPRWVGSTTAAASRSDLANIAGFDPNITENDLEDRSTYGIGFGAKHASSERTQLGLKASYRHFRPDLHDDENVYQAAFTADRLLRRNASFGFELGAYSRRSDVRTIGGLHGALSLSGTLERSAFNLSLSHGASAGTTLVGTSTDTKIQLGFSARASRDWSWSVRSHYALREPTSSDVSDVRTVGLTLGLEWRATRKLAFAVRSSFVEQEADDPTFDTSIATATAGLVWYPKSFAQ